MITGEFLDYNNVVVSEDEKGYKVSVEITDRTLNPFDMVHGGLTFSLGDTVMGLETRKISGGKTAVTLNASIEFLRPGKGKYLIARGKVIKLGKQTCTLQAEIKNEEDKLIAIMTSTYIFIS